MNRGVIYTPNGMLGGRSTRLHTVLVMWALCLALRFPANAQDSASSVNVQLDSKNAGPRVVESLTERAILRDYRSAWAGISHALEFNVVDPIEQPFTGDAKSVLKETIASQQKSSMRQRYVAQNHKLEAVFYAPEGDVIELHDTAEYQQQILDGGKTIQEQRVVLHYVVLMTPSADRWVIRQLQSVPQF
ncbi:MAG: hypothetical protein WA718_08250 [Terriglobales bacterium]